MASTTKELSEKNVLDQTDCSEKNIYEPVGETTTSIEPLEASTENVLSWRDDPANAHNWPATRKYTVTLLLSALVFNTVMSSTMIAPALSQITKDLHIQSDAQTQLVLSIYVLAYAVGYFFWAPLSEVYGRVPVLQVATAWFFIWNMVCGFATSKALITAGRLFSGSGASASIAISSGMLGEVWRPEQRGRSMAILSIITNLGPCIGPVIGGIIAERSLSSWRWAFWTTTILNAVLQLLTIPFLHESHAQTIIRKRDRLAAGAPKQEKRQLPLRILVQAFRRPFYLLRTQPAAQGIVIYASLCYGDLYTIIVAIPVAFESVYHESIMISSLNYLSFGLGTMLGAQSCGRLNDWMYRRNKKRHSEKEKTDADHEGEISEKLPYRPPAEIRLYLVGPAVFLITIGLLVFGWTLQSGKVHWIVPDIGLFLFGIGNQTVVQCTNAYMIDMFSEIKSAAALTDALRSSSTRTVAEGPRAQPSTQANINWTASAMASIWTLKSVFGFVYPLFAIDMIKGLGWGWSFTLLALVNLLVGLPLIGGMLKWGWILREKGRRTIEQKIMSQG